MKKQIMINIICSFVFLFIGLIIGAKDFLPKNFFEINIYHVASIILTIIIGIVFSYFLNVKNSKLNKKIDYIIKQSMELDAYFDSNSQLIMDYLQNFEDANKKKHILLYFKTISSKISIIKKLNLAFCSRSAESIYAKCEDYRNRITGDEWGIVNALDDNALDAFKKDVASCRSILQNIITDCLNQ